MSDLFQKALTLITGETPKISTKTPKSLKASKSATDFLRMPKNRPLKNLTERDLISLESQIGAQIFGVAPKGTRREFFNLDPTTWIWHEASEKGETTVRYEVHDHGILKVLGGARYEFIEGEELDRFVTAVLMYYERVAREVYQRDPATGQKSI